MTKQQVVDILTSLGYKVTEEIDETYVLYTKDNHNIWLGNYYIENENRMVAYPYKDDIATVEELCDYLGGEGYIKLILSKNDDGNGHSANQ